MSEALTSVFRSLETVNVAPMSSCPPAKDRARSDDKNARYLSGIGIYGQLVVMVT